MLGPCLSIVTQASDMAAYQESLKAKIPVTVRRKRL